MVRGEEFEDAFAGVRVRHAVDLAREWGAHRFGALAVGGYSVGPGLREQAGADSAAAGALVEVRLCEEELYYYYEADDLGAYVSFLSVVIFGAERTM